MHAVRNCDEFAVLSKDVENILDWVNTSKKAVEIPFKPARVLMQDFTYVSHRLLAHLCSLLDLAH